MAPPLEALHTLLDTSAVASLAVLDAGAPAVSLVPYALSRAPLRLYLLVSELSSHTAALRAEPRCALLVSEPPRAGDPRSNHALARASLRCTARFLTRAEAEEAGAARAYRAKYAIAEQLLGLADFHFVELVPAGASFVQGFGRAFTVDGPELRELTHLTGR